MASPKLMSSYLRDTTLAGLVAIVAGILLRRLPKGFQGDVFPQANKLIWLVLITQNVLAQLVTGPLTQWQEVAFNIYYVLLFMTSAVIVYHYHFVQGAASRSSQRVP